MNVAGELGPDGHPSINGQFMQYVLPMVEMADKEGESLYERVKALLDVVQVQCLIMSPPYI